MKKLIAVLFIVLFSTKIVISQTYPESRRPSDSQYSRTGLLNIIELNAGFGLGTTGPDYSKSYIGLTSILGYGLTKNLSGGVGAGISFFNGGILAPVFIDLRFILNFRRTSIFACGKGGYLLSFSDPENENRYFLNPGLGIRYQIGKKLAANLGAGLVRQVTKDKVPDSFINANLGITYKLGR